MNSFVFNRLSVRRVILGAAASSALAAGILLSPMARAQAPAPDLPSAPALAQSHVEVAREVVVLSGIARTFDGMLPTFADQVRQLYITRPEISADLNAVLDQLRPELDARKEDILTAAARILASRINEENLTEIRAFFRSTAGQQYVATQPLVLDDLFAAMNTWVGEVSGFLVERVREEMRKKGHDV
ncbi:MAG: DUF2059 domain-containing protein [Pseudochelatococcus sp.]|jgi:hypothetical protein|uniref:DUF2059 domain-containing protein n=1 Tax=Pseudochelatococcus sp. TaxID=2020869 RepID=UPI003D913CBC